jgi:hypothetical protein
MENFDSNTPSRGLGDTIAKFTHATGIDKLVEVTAEVLGIEDCGCNGRRETLNNVFPYEDVKPNSPPIFDPDNSPKTENGIYEILHHIHATKSEQQFKFIPGDKVLMTEEHLLYSDWAYYISIGAVKKTT